VAYGRGVGWFECPSCSGIDASEWLHCLAEAQEEPAPKAGSGPSRRRRAKDAESATWYDLAGEERIEELTRELFRLHDLNNDGVLEEIELIRLNQKIAIMHHGMDIDIAEVRSKYRSLFRARLDPNGNPVGYETFRAYTREVIDNLDPDPEAQEMILEQFVVEAQTGRQALILESLLKEPDFPLKEADFPRVLHKVVADMEIGKSLSPADDSCAEWQLSEATRPATAGFETPPIEVATEWHYLDRGRHC